MLLVFVWYCMVSLCVMPSRFQSTATSSVSLLLLIGLRKQLNSTCRLYFILYLELMPIDLRWERGLLPWLSEVLISERSSKVVRNDQRCKKQREERYGMFHRYDEELWQQELLWYLNLVSKRLITVKFPLQRDNKAW